MFFETFEHKSLNCPYCRRKLTNLAPGENPDKYEVFKAGFFTNGQMNVTCRFCGGKSGINIKRW